MKRWLLLLLPGVLFAQDDPFADDDWDNWEDDTAAAPWTGFVEGGYGTRFSADPLLAGRATLEELRWRVENEWFIDALTIGLAADGGHDFVDNDWFGDVRRLSLGFKVGASTDVTIGREVQTWGVGDLLFLNDLFPKDFVSFFAGRDDEYLKAPGNALRFTHYAALVNVDFVWTPVFEADAYLTGERFSFFSPLAGRTVAPVPPFGAVEPDESFSNGEFALRLFRAVEGTEYALYSYRGWFKQPTALTPGLQPTFAPMNAWGASLRLPLGPGLFSTEVAYYDSRDDGDGTDPLTPNDQARFLGGYEWQAAPNFTVGLQYYVELTLDHDELIANSPSPAFEPDEYRHLLTNRLTYRAARDRYTGSLFTFYSPSDDDFYLRPSFTWRYSDQWQFVAGGNVFGGDADHTFFNQLQDASNAYLRVRFNY